jgi:GT2 family glycosyltransferase
MKIALISTVFNEGASIARWINALMAQTVQPGEFVIGDGSSTDGTVNLLKQGFERAGFQNQSPDNMPASVPCL